MFATLFAASLVMAPGRNRRAWLVALVLCYVFAANCFSITREWSTTPFNILQSYLFFSALGVIGMLRLVVTGAEPRRASTE